MVGTRTVKTHRRNLGKGFLIKQNPSHQIRLNEFAIFRKALVITSAFSFITRYKALWVGDNFKRPSGNQ